MPLLPPWLHDLPLHDLPLFVAAALLVNLTPGPDMLFVASTSATAGRRAGLMAALGVGAGCFVHIALAVLGLSALLTTSAWALAALKWLGAAYLVWMGMTMLWERRTPAGRAPADPQPPGGRSNGWPAGASAGALMAPRKAFWMGAMTNALNPKVALFFLAFLPQFIHPSAVAQAWALAALGLWFTASGTLINLGVAGLAGWLGRRAESHANGRAVGRWLRRVAGAVFVGLGVRLAFSAR